MESNLLNEYLMLTKHLENNSLPSDEYLKREDAMEKLIRYYSENNQEEELFNLVGHFQKYYALIEKLRPDLKPTLDIKRKEYSEHLLEISKSIKENPCWTIPLLSSYSEQWILGFYSEVIEQNNYDLLISLINFALRRNENFAISAAIYRAGEMNFSKLQQLMNYYNWGGRF